VLSAATRIRPPVAGVVSLSGASGFGGVDAQGAMARLRVPVLFVVAAADRPPCAASWLTTPDGLRDQSLRPTRNQVTISPLPLTSIGPRRSNR
jgi:hypothetical protein